MLRGQRDPVTLRAAGKRLTATPPVPGARQSGVRGPPHRLHPTPSSLHPEGIFHPRAEGGRRGDETPLVRSLSSHLGLQARRQSSRPESGGICTPAASFWNLPHNPRRHSPLSSPPPALVRSPTRVPPPHPVNACLGLTLCPAPAALGIHEGKADMSPPMEGPKISEDDGREPTSKNLCGSEEL